MGSEILIGAKPKNKNNRKSISRNESIGLQIKSLTEAVFASFFKWNPWKIIFFRNCRAVNTLSFNYSVYFSIKVSGSVYFLCDFDAFFPNFWNTEIWLADFYFRPFSPSHMKDSTRQWDLFVANLLWLHFGTTKSIHCNPLFLEKKMNIIHVKVIILDGIW